MLLLLPLSPPYLPPALVAVGLWEEGDMVWDVPTCLFFRLRSIDCVGAYMHGLFFGAHGEHVLRMAVTHCCGC